MPLDEHTREAIKWGATGAGLAWLGTVVGIAIARYIWGWS